MQGNKITFISYINLKYIFTQCKDRLYFLYIYIYIILLNIYLIIKVFLVQHSVFFFKTFINKKNIQQFTIQRAPMAHRRWSQEQYKVTLYYWIICYNYKLTSFWLNCLYNNISYFTFFYYSLFLFFSTSVVFFKNSISSICINFFLYY